MAPSSKRQSEKGLPMELKRKISPGARVASMRQMRTIRTEIDATVAANMAKGLVNPWWAKGVLTRHIAIGLWEPISMCGRYVSHISSQPMPTIIGIACPSCVRAWNRHMDASNARVGVTDAKYLADLTDEFDLLIGSGNPEALTTRWSELEDNLATRQSVRDLLDERDVDLAGALEQAEALAEAASKK